MPFYCMKHFFLFLHQLTYLKIFLYVTWKKITIFAKRKIEDFTNQYVLIDISITNAKYKLKY